MVAGKMAGSVKVGPLPVSEVGPGGIAVQALEAQMAAILKEHRERWKGWMTEGSQDGVEISSKKLADAYPLKLWRVWTDIEAPPEEVLHRLLRERDVWDEDVVKWREVKRLGGQMEVFQYVANDMPPHPTRDYCLLRAWRRGVGDVSGRETLVLVEASVGVDGPGGPGLMGGVPALVLAARFLMEPAGAGRTRLTHLARVDTKGRGKGWYAKVFAARLAKTAAALRDSFRQPQAAGPETKV